MTAMGQGGRLAGIGLAAALEEQAYIRVQGWLIRFDGEGVVGRLKFIAARE